MKLKTNFDHDFHSKYMANTVKLGWVIFKNGLIREKFSFLRIFFLASLKIIGKLF